MKKETTELTGIKEQIIKAAITNFHEFGFPGANKDNIFTDLVYSEIFRSMLEENRGHSPKSDAVLEEIMSEIKPEHG